MASNKIVYDRLFLSNALPSGLSVTIGLGAWLCAALLLVFVERLSVPPNPWDRRILGLSHGFRSIRLDRFFALITWGGSLYLLVPVTVLVIAFLAKQGRTDEGWLLALSLAGVALLSRLAKLWFDRPRPDFFPVDGDIPLDASYPSAHTAQIVVFALTLWWIVKPEKIGLIYFLLMGGLVMLMSAVTLSRIYLQVHYPSDVLGGILLAVLWTVGLFYMLEIPGFSVR
jgi:membrane-associated phospholipid phosphatase